jgi:hypothetical protein
MIVSRHVSFYFNFSLPSCPMSAHYSLSLFCFTLFSADRKIFSLYVLCFVAFTMHSMLIPDPSIFKYYLFNYSRMFCAAISTDRWAAQKRIFLRRWEFNASLSVLNCQALDVVCLWSHSSNSHRKLSFINHIFMVSKKQQKFDSQKFNLSSNDHSHISSLWSFFWCAASEINFSLVSLSQNKTSFREFIYFTSSLFARRRARWEEEEKQ